MAATPPPYKMPSASASVARSTTSRDAMRSLADEMLRASLVRGGAPPASASASISSATSATSSASASTISPIPSSPPSYRRSEITPSGGYSGGERISAGPPRPPILGSASVTHDSLLRKNIPHRDVKLSSSFTSPSNVSSSSSTTTISAADAKARVRNLQKEMERARAAAPRPDSAGIFKAACSTDLVFIIDTTGSMYSYIAAAKDQITSIVDDIKASFLNESKVRVAVVSYKDHGDHPNIEYLDFTPSAAEVSGFLGRLTASGGADTPEDVLGGVNQALNLSWRQQTRCIIHIADAPPHGAGVLHDLDAGSDNYPSAGSEPHGLTYEPILKQLMQMNVNYALLRVNSSTDRMALAFAEVYKSSKGDAKLLPSNVYASQVNGLHRKSHSGLWSGASTQGTGLQLEEMELGTTYGKLKHLVVKTVTSSVSRSAGRMSLALKSTPSAGTSGIGASGLAPITEDEGSGGTIKAANLERGPPRWDTPGWLDETLEVEGFCPDMVVQSANSLNEMMNDDENIKLGVTQLTIQARSKPFAEGSVRVASYARTAASTSKFVVKSFKEGGKILAHLAEDMRIQALCKAFALEFNGLLKIEPPIDFVMTTCLQKKAKGGSEGECLSLEPFIDGEYIKYNSNSMFVKEDPPGEPDPFNEIAQAFSHFTFERSWGHFLVNDLQGVGHLLTDPAIQTIDHERFDLAETNLHEDGFKFFFVTHECNSICRKLELKSNREMACSGVFSFRERWPALEPTVCCSNKLCRSIIRLASAKESDKFPSHHWCAACWPQLQSSLTRWICMAPGPNHEFDTSKFFYESQGLPAPKRCPNHVEKDKSMSSAAMAGKGLWGRMKAEGSKLSISGRSW